MKVEMGDFLLADLAHYLDPEDPTTSRIAAFLLGIRIDWDQVRSVSLNWTTEEIKEDYKTVILPVIKIELFP